VGGNALPEKGDAACPEYAHGEGNDGLSEEGMMERVARGLAYAEFLSFPAGETGSGIRPPNPPAARPFE